jgi:uncharacterized membrane protein YfcA
LDLTFLLIVGIIGLVTGLASGLFGIGGGALRIPLLALIGLPLISAFGINLVAIPASSLVGSVSQRRNVDTRLGAYMALGGSIGTVLGTLIAFSLSVSGLLLASVFLIVSVLSVIGLNLGRISPHTASHLRASFLTLTLGTFAANTLTGMRGGSEGSLFTPILRTLNVEMHRAIATSLFAAVFTSVVGVTLYWSGQHLLILPGVVVLVGSALGSTLGSHFSLESKPRSLESGLTALIILLSIVPLLMEVL